MLVFISGDPKHHHGLLFRGVSMDQIINRVLAKLQITVGPMGKNENPVVMSHVPANIFEWQFLAVGENTHVGSLLYWCSKEGQRQISKTSPILAKIINQRQYCVPREMAKINTAIKDLH